MSHDYYQQSMRALQLAGMRCPLGSDQANSLTLHTILPKTPLFFSLAAQF